MSAVQERSFVVASELGLHARPAGEFAKIAQDAQAEIRVSRGGGDGEWVDGTSTLSLLTLAAAQGTTLTVRAEGPDAAGVLEKLGALIERKQLP